MNLYYRDFTREATVTTVYSACVVKVESVGSIAVPDLPQDPRCPGDMASRVLYVTSASQIATKLRAGLAGAR